jgi:hypothetical protein
MLASCASSGSPSGREHAPGAVTGVVVQVDARGLGDVRSFVVKDGSTTYAITVDPDITYDFPLDHLSEHKTSGAPVRVELRERNGELVATSIRDA